MTISTLITILIIAVIIDILITRHLGSNIDDVLKIIELQTKNIQNIRNRGSYHTDLLQFVVDNITISTDFVYKYGNAQEKGRVCDMMDKYKEDEDEDVKES